MGFLQNLMGGGKQDDSDPSIKPPAPIMENDSGISMPGIPTIGGGQQSQNGFQMGQQIGNNFADAYFAAKGGYIPHFADGGMQTLPLQQPTTQQSNVTGALTAGNPFGANNNPGPFGNAAAGAVTNTVGQGIQGVGGLMQNIGSAFTSQNGYQAQLAPQQYSDFGNLINQSGNQFLGNFGGEQALAGQLQANALGQGPNPAQTMLANQTGQNTANQAALMASQRGAGANAGLITRQAGMQGAANQQNAIGQSALLQAQQQLAAQQALGNLYGQIGTQGVQGLGAGAGAQNAQNLAQIQNLGNAQGINAQVAQNNANAVNKTTGGLLGGASSLLSMLNKGGEVRPPSVEHYHTLPQHTAGQYASGGPVSSAGRYLCSGDGIPMSSGGQVPAMVSPGEITLSRAESRSPQSAASAASQKANLKERVPGHAKVKGDSLKNDTVKTTLDAGGIVVPRTKSEDPKKAAAFAARVAMKKGKK